MKHSKTENHPFISLVIPAYNEAKRIANSLTVIQDYLINKPYSSELIVVDDGSTDSTSELVEAVLHADPTARLIKYSPNKGKGYAVKTGILTATGEYVLFLDADLATPIEELDKFLTTMEKGYDIAIGTRKNKAANIVNRQPYIRELLGKGFTLLTNILLVKEISDITCGFKMFRTEVAKDLFGRQLIYNWSFDAEILFLAQKLDYSIKEVPVTWCDAEGTKVRLFRDIIGSLKGILQIRMNYYSNSYDLKKRMPLCYKERKS